MQTLNKHFATIAKAAFQRHGFASEQLAAQWAVIVGDEIANVAKPDKILWPRKTGDGHKLGGTLVLRAHAGRALDIHYQTPHVIERVNQFLGYGAIAAIKVVQTADGPETPKPLLQPMRAEAKAAWDREFEGVSDDALKAALGRLAGHVSPAGPLSTVENPAFLSPTNSSRKTA